MVPLIRKYRVAALVNNNKDAQNTQLDLFGFMDIFGLGVFTRKQNEFSIGALIPVTILESRKNRYPNQVGFYRAESFRCSIEKFNSLRAIRGATVYYNIQDTGNSNLNTFYSTMSFTTGGDGESQVVIGLDTSDAADFIGRYFNDLKFPVIAYGATSLALNDTKVFSTISRVVPSRKYTIDAMLKTAVALKWRVLSGIFPNDVHGLSSPRAKYIDSLHDNYAGL
ncbi:periplasmic binding protein-like I [Rozella allomycis CSF55]|uniref:Periplasmic binding protein-like I n=1 Tax=Rozella allomycis (strain CSF55) TaxID=988480 RepID=A0A075B1F2_ROZAC|nr:hypothetical protein O9G_001905 [Rozella allomycis CSF55]RKP21333.1 periplasmic binding protein-like I [Rozella allomycis CSF55]|eukprot:EPZ34603.1 hypothetical protein O9G_001905 [Rozella allomycis CSF55]